MSYSESDEEEEDEYSCETPCASSMSSSVFFSQKGAAFSSRRDDWATPQATFNKLNAEFRFTLDAAASDTNHKCKRYYTEKQDGLIQNWKQETVFLNPPYGRTIGDWMQKAYLSSCQGAVVVALVPSRTDTRWWHAYVQNKAEVRFLAGRLKFGAGTGSAPFPSAVVVYRPG